MYAEDELLPISALQHLAFCERQWGLIYLEQVWEENRLTVEGHFLHERAHEAEIEVRGNVRIARGLLLQSRRLGLTGKADVVEFHRQDKAEYAKGGVKLEGIDGLWKPVIVEYKHGKPKLARCDEVQVCAQALCLEDMLQVSIPLGVLFYGKPRRRYEVIFDEALRAETEVLAKRLHELTRAGETPSACYSSKCRNCSLVEVCLPKTVGPRRDVHSYLAKAIAETKESMS